MILVFGGTTEGRKAVEVLEEAGTTYYYSTLSDGQKIELVHGIHLTGGMEVPEMIACCREHPEFDGHQVDWDLIIHRMGAFKPIEAVAREHVCNLYKGI